MVKYTLQESTKGKGKEVRWRRDFEQSQEDFGRESVAQNIWRVPTVLHEGREKGSGGWKRSTGMWNKTQVKTH